MTVKFTVVKALQRATLSWALNTRPSEALDWQANKSRQKDVVDVKAARALQATI